MKERSEVGWSEIHSIESSLGEYYKALEKESLHRVQAGTRTWEGHEKEKKRINRLRENNPILGLSIELHSLRNGC